MFFFVSGKKLYSNNRYYGVSVQNYILIYKTCKMDVMFLSVRGKNSQLKHKMV